MKQSICIFSVFPCFCIFLLFFLSNWRNHYANLSWQPYFNIFHNNTLTCASKSQYFTCHYRIELDKKVRRLCTRRLSLDRFDNDHNFVNFKARKMLWVPKFAKKYFKLCVFYIISLSLKRFLSNLQKRPFLLRPKVSLLISPFCPMLYSIHFLLCLINTSKDKSRAL